MSRLPDSGPDPTHSPTEPSSIPSEAGPQNTSGLAVTALALGILGFCFAPSGLIAIILGIVALTQIANPAQRLKGQGLAVAGLILGGTGMVVSVIAILIGILLPALGAARTTARKMQNNTQVRGIHQAMVIYAQGNANHFPGLDAEGDPVDLTVEGRFEILLEGGFSPVSMPSTRSRFQTRSPGNRGWRSGPPTIPMRSLTSPIPAGAAPCGVRR